MDEKKDEYTLRVDANSNGDVALLGLRGPAVNSENMTKYSDLLSQLKGIPKPAGKGRDGISITIEAANDLRYSRLIEIMDLCKSAGYESVNLDAAEQAAAADEFSWLGVSRLKPMSKESG